MGANALAINEGINFTAYNGSGSDIPQYARLKFRGAKVNGCIDVDVCGVGDNCIGVAQVPIAAGAYGNCRFENAPGTQIGIAAEAISAGAQLYSAASGKVKDTTSVSTVMIGIALSDTSADGELIEYQAIPRGVTASS